MLGAFLYLRFVSLANLAASRIRRLRQPKYLFGALVGGAYFYYFLLRRMGAGMPQGAAAAASGLVILSGAGLTLAFLVGRMALAWIFPSANPGLRFTEAEIAFLFPAPVRRRTLIHYRLLSSQLAILLTSVFIGFVTLRFRSAGGNTAMRIAGWWVMLSIFELHGNATALTLAGVRERGESLRSWRIGAAAIFGIYAAAVLGSVYAYGRTPTEGDLMGIDAIHRYAAGVAASGPLPWLLLPFKIVLAPLLASGPGEFAKAMIPALLVLAAHYFWAVRTETAFEEGSMALAEKRAAAISAAGAVGETGDATAPSARLLSRAATPTRAVREPFRLGSRGRPETAFLWKNILSIQGFFFTRRARVLSAVIALTLLFSFRSVFIGRAGAGKADLAPVVVAGSIMAAFYTLLLGPQFARMDLRSDLPNADILKTYPLAGWQVALGELLAPTAILTAILWLAILAPAVVLGAGGGSEWLTPGLRTAGAVCLAAIAPILCLIQLLVPNMLMILFPAWYQASRSRGVEAMGQRLIFVFGQLLVAVIAIAPAAAAAAVVVFASQWLLGAVAAIMLGTLAAVAILGCEAAVGVWWLGERFERFDLSSELRP